MDERFLEALMAADWWMDLEHHLPGMIACKLFGIRISANYKEIATLCEKHDLRINFFAGG